MFAQSLWRLLPPSRCPSMSRCVVPAPCRGRASPAPVEWEDVSPSWKWWQVTSWWTSQAGTSLSICSSHQTDCACTGRTAVGGFNKEKEKERERNIDNLVSSIVHTRTGYHFNYFDIDVNLITQVRYHFNTKIPFFITYLWRILTCFWMSLDQFSQQIVNVQKTFKIWFHHWRKKEYNNCETH